MTEYTVRRPQSFDVEHVLELAREHHATSCYADVPFDSRRVLDTCQSWMKSPDYGCFVLEANTAVAGYMAVTLDTYLWADVPLVHDLALYVEPRHRSLTAFKMLTGMAEQWARDRGARTLLLGLSSPRDPVTLRRYGAVYQHAGYTFHGELYTKELNNG